MDFNNLTQNCHAKDYIIGFDNNKGYLIRSSDKDAGSFFKLLSNLIIQESFKPLHDQSFIELDVILNMLRKNIADIGWDKAPYDYDTLLDIDLHEDKEPNLLFGNRIKKEANRIKRRFNEHIASGNLGDTYLVFLNADDQIFELRDNEQRTLALVFYYFLEGCKKYMLNPMRVLRAMRKKIYSYRQQMILKVQQASDHKPLLFYKIANGGRVDFDRSVEAFAKERKVQSVILKKLTYNYHFCDYFTSTKNTVYMLVSQQSADDTLDYIQDVFHYFMSNLSSQEKVEVRKYIDNFLQVYQEGFNKRKDYLEELFPTLTKNNWINEKNVPFVKPTFNKEPNVDDANSILSSISSLFESSELMGYFFMWHTSNDADANGAGSVGEKDEISDMAGVLLQLFGYTALVYPSIRKDLLNWHVTYPQIWKIIQGE